MPSAQDSKHTMHNGWFSLTFDRTPSLRTIVVDLTHIFNQQWRNPRCMLAHGTKGSVILYMHVLWGGVNLGFFFFLEQRTSIWRDEKD